MTETAFEMPPETRNAAGDERRVGFELEFAGLALEDAAAAVREVFGGDVEEEGPFRLRVAGTALGDFQVEVDASVLQDRRYLEILRDLGVAIDLAELEKPIEKMVGWLAELVVPFEVTTPPVPLGELSRVESLRAALAAREARGTGSRLRYAFGLHINPEVPSPEGESLLRHLRAFLVLYGWLKESSDVDLTRRLTPFIDEFPASYLRLALDPAYAPSLAEMAADYVTHNPTRNRPLDLLPVFADRLGIEALEGLPEDEPLSPRPTFHYRLPNCRIDEPDWTVAAEWNRWTEVERLAARPDELARRCAAARRAAAEPGLWRRIRELVLGPEEP